jgi:hypothetical protein
VQYRTVSSIQCYEAFSEAGIDYGAGFKGIDEIYTGKDKVLAKLSPHIQLLDNREQFVLHPGLMDSALQASTGLVAPSAYLNPVMPYSAREIEILSGCAQVMWAYARLIEEVKRKITCKNLILICLTGMGRCVSGLKDWI